MTWPRVSSDRKPIVADCCCGQAKANAGPGCRICDANHAARPGHVQLASPAKSDWIKAGAAS